MGQQSSRIVAPDPSQHFDTHRHRLLVSGQPETAGIRGADMSQFAPFGTLFRYFAFRFIGWICLCLFSLVAIISLIQTIELVRRVSVLTRDVPDVNYLAMALLNIPNVMHMILPFAILSGAMLCFSAWNRSNEFVAVRGFGQSIWASLGPALFAGFMVGMAFITVINPIGAVTSPVYEAKLADIFGNNKNDMTVSESGIWIRDSLPDGKLIFHGDSLDADASQIINPVIYEFNQASKLRRVIKADSSQLTKTGWMIENAVSWQSNGAETALGHIILPTSLGELNLQQSSLSPQALSIFQLPEFIMSLEHAGIPATAHRIHLYQLLALPLMMVGITMLAARATLTNSLRGSRSRLFIRGVLLATAIFIFTYFMQVMGVSLRIPTIVAAWTPAFTVFLIGAIILARGDEA
jgi:lipopolysaccharide export system permease protein